jgi:hypothetical protein
VIFELSYLGWMLAVGTAMNVRAPLVLRRGSTLHYLGLAISVGYAFFSSYLFAPEPIGGPLKGILVTVHILSMCVNLYLLWFVSRSLVVAEEQSKPSLDRVLGIFFALWFTMFIPIAAWWVQTRARRVARVGYA